MLELDHLPTAWGHGAVTGGGPALALTAWGRGAVTGRGTRGFLNWRGDRQMFGHAAVKACTKSHVVRGKGRCLLSKAML